MVALTVAGRARFLAPTPSRAVLRRPLARRSAFKVPGEVLFEAIDIKLPVGLHSIGCAHILRLRGMGAWFERAMVFAGHHDVLTQKTTMLDRAMPRLSPSLL